MATLAPAPATPRGRVTPLVLVPARAVLDTYRLGLRSFVAAPLLVALAVVPQAVQHVAELQFGMFASREAFIALQNDPTRMAFGMAKVAGLLLAITAIARFWALGSVRAALLPGWRTLLLSALLFGASEFVVWVLDGVEDAVGEPWSYGFTALTATIQIGIVVAMVAVLLEDGEVTPRTLLCKRWPALVYMALCLGAAFAPAAWLHGKMHHVAFAQPEWLAWALMGVDALVVGAIAALTGAALAVGYAATGRRPSSF